MCGNNNKKKYKELEKIFYFDNDIVFYFNKNFLELIYLKFMVRWLFIRIECLLTTVKITIRSIIAFLLI